MARGPDVAAGPERRPRGRPGWWRRTFALQPGSAPPVDVVRAVVTVVVPVATVLALGRGDVLLFAVVAAVVVAFSPAVGPVTSDARTLAAAAAAALVGAVVGAATAPAQTLSALPVVLVMAALAGLLATSTPRLASPSTQLLVAYAVTSGSRGSTTAPTVVVVFVATALFASALALLQAARTPPDRRAADAVAAALRACAAWVREPDGRGRLDPVVGAGRRRARALPRRQVVTRRLDEARRAVDAEEDGTRAQRRTAGAHDVLLVALAPLVGPIGGSGGVAGTTSGGPASGAGGSTGATGPDEPVARALERLADAVSSGSPVGDGGPSETDRPAARAVVTATAAWERALREGPRARGAGERLRAVLAAVGRPRWQQVLRYVVVLGVAETVRLSVPVPRSYWVLLTAVVVFQPGGAAAFPRAVQRSAGTVLGVLVAGLVLVAGPPAWGAVVVVGVLAAAGALVRQRSYALFTACFTPVVLVVSALAARPPLAGLLVDRLVDTLLGVGVVLLVGWALQPSTWRRGVRVNLEPAVVAVRDHVVAAFAGRDAQDGSAGSRSRRHAYDVLAALDVRLQPILAEPDRLADRARSSLEVAAQLERTVDAVAAAQDSFDDGGQHPGRGAVDAVVAALDEVAAAVRERRAPRLPPMPGGALAEVADGVRDVAGAVAQRWAVPQPTR